MINKTYFVSQLWHTGRIVNQHGSGNIIIHLSVSHLHFRLELDAKHSRHKVWLQHLLGCSWFLLITADRACRPVFRRMKAFYSLIILTAQSQLCWTCTFQWEIMRSEPVDTKHRRNQTLYLHTLLSCSADVSRLKLDFIEIIGLKGWNNCGLCMFCTCWWGFPQGSPASSHNSNTRRLGKLVGVSEVLRGEVHKCVILAPSTFGLCLKKPVFDNWLS